MCDKLTALELGRALHDQALEIVLLQRRIASTQRHDLTGSSTSGHVVSASGDSTITITSDSPIPMEIRFENNEFKLSIVEGTARLELISKMPL